MSTNLLDELNDLISDEGAQTAYKHEIAISAFTNDIARLMGEQGVSQSELARRLGVSRARVSQLMQHKSSPTLRTMVEIANALGCDVVPGLTPRGLQPAGTGESHVAASRMDDSELVADAVGALARESRGPYRPRSG